jgi:hypothetical protein
VLRVAKASVIFVSCCVAVVLAACGASGSGTAASGPSAAAATAGTAAASPSAGHVADLISYLTPIPAGARAATSFRTATGATFAVPADGRLTKAGAASLATSPQAADLLGTAFKGGAVRAWSAGGRLVLVQLLQFTDAGAAGANFDWTQSTVSSLLRSSQRHAVDGLSRTLVVAATPAGSRAGRLLHAYGYAAVGDILAIVIVSTTSGKADGAAAETVLRQQYARL